MLIFSFSFSTTFDVRITTMSRLQKLPYFISYFLGYRKPNYEPKKIPQWRIYFWSFLAAWTGIALLEILFTYSSAFRLHHSPMIVASFGATAVLAYGVIEAPLAQPRNILGGHIIGSLTGVIIAQLFLNIQHNWASEDQRTVVQWVGGATAMAISLNLMQITKTVHPPAGASALIAVVTDSIIDISWFYIAIIAVSALIQVAVACLFNNVERRYPQYWWKPHTPFKVDPQTITTVMPNLDNEKDMPEDVVSTNLSIAEEGRLQQGRDSASTIQLYTPSTSVESAVKTLQNYAELSKVSHSASSVLSEDDLDTLHLILQKFNPTAKY